MNALDLAYAAAALLSAPLWMRKARGGWPERLGRTPPLPAPLHPSPRPRLLLHAVSVGEAAALRSLVPLLKPHAEVVVSATTDTGLARARALYADSCAVVRYPLDFSASVRRFLDAVRPDAVALVELELWPNFIAECRRRNIPVAVINGRLSERSFRNYRRARPLLGGMFRALAFAAVQDEAYAARFRHMGVPEGRLHITGSMKWDNAPIDDAPTGPGSPAHQLAAELGLALGDRPLVVAGSTGPGEEALLHAACARLEQSGRPVRLLCAPRKPERFDEAAAAMPGCVRRSATRGTVRPPDPARSRFLLDSLGELRAAYTLADVVVVGRSFGGLHGSDPTEPIGLGKPVVMGPRAGDFAAMVAAFERAGAILRADEASLDDTLRRLFTDPQRRAEAAAAGRACIVHHRGASARHADLLAGLLAARLEGRSVAPPAGGAPGPPGGVGAGE